MGTAIPAARVMEGPLPCIIFDRVSETPDRPFIVEVGGRDVTYAQFLDQVGQYISAFEAVGIGPDDRVATLVPQSIEAQAIWVAIAWMNGWEVPINNEFHGDMLVSILNDCRAPYLATTEEFLPAITAVLDRLEDLREIIVIDADQAHDIGDVKVHIFDPAIKPSARIQSRPPLTDGDVATVIYTSGTTGPSKGVILPWGELYSGIDIFGCRKDGTDALYTPFPVNHVSGKVPVNNMATLAGRAVIRRRFSTSDFWKDICDHGCTGTILLGGTAVFLNNQPPSPSDRDNPMHTVLMGPVMDDYPSFEERFGVSVVTSYGMSECGHPFISPPGGLVNGESCGQLRDIWHVRIVDSNGDDVETGEIGELLVKCDRPYALMLRYLGRPEATAEAMRGGWFHTGDAMRADAEGNYYFVDRIKDAIRRRGENISSFEVEAFILKFPGIAECAAVAVPSETGEDEIKVFFTALGAPVDMEALVAFCVAEMPNFMVPRYFEQRSGLPYTPTNKIQKSKLRALGMSETWDRIEHDRGSRKRAPQPQQGR